MFQCRGMFKLVPLWVCRCGRGLCAWAVLPCSVDSGSTFQESEPWQVLTRFCLEEIGLQPAPVSTRKSNVLTSWRFSCLPPFYVKINTGHCKSRARRLQAQCMATGPSLPAASPLGSAGALPGKRFVFLPTWGHQQWKGGPSSGLPYRGHSFECSGCELRSRFGLFLFKEASRTQSLGPEEGFSCLQEVEMGWVA